MKYQAMISIERMKELMEAPEMSDERVAKIREILYYFVKKKMDIEMEKLNLDL